MAYEECDSTDMIGELFGKCQGVTDEAGDALPPLDILRPLKEADSLGWRAMSRTESTDNVTSRVDIPIMQDATTRTGPLSYP